MLDYNMKPFRFWCQKVLPLVYDDSLSYMELLCKVVNYLNHIIEDINGIPDYINQLISEDKLKEIMTELMDELREQVARANEGTNTTASYDRTTDELVWLNGKLIRMTRDILAGDRYVEDTGAVSVTGNYVYTSIEIEMTRIKSDLSQTKTLLNTEITNRINGDTALQTAIDNEATARANADTALQTAIDNEATARTNADTALQTAIDNEATARANADTALQGEIGTLSALSTTAKDNLVNSINEVLGIAQGNKSLLDGKTIQIFGDSISDENATNLLPNWVTKLRALLPSTTINNNSVTGRKMVDLSNILYNISSFTADIVIVFLGTNDFGSDIAFGDWSTGNVNTEFCTAMQYIVEQINTKNTSKCSIYFITPPCRSDKYVNTLHYTLEMYRASIRGFCKGHGCNFINGEDIPLLNRFYPTNYYNSDMVHPSSDMSQIVCNYIVNGILSNGNDCGGSMGNINSLPLNTNNFSGSVLFGMDGEEMFIKGKITPLVAITGIQDITVSINELLNDVYGSVKPMFIMGNYYDTSGTKTFTVYFDETSHILKIATGTEIPINTELFIDYKVSPAWCNIGTTE